MSGVDISHYQKGLTIRQIKDAGYEFAIIKLTEGTWLVDSAAFDFYREAYELGFPVGCYCYSHATNAPQAMAEAAYLLEAINGFPMPCGIFLDIEEPKQLGLTHDELLNVIRGWCAGIGGKGYIPGVYSSEGTLWAKISPDELPDGCLVWVAHYGKQPDVACDLWQSSDSGRVDGYDGPVDTDEVRSAYFEALVLRGFPEREPEPDEGDAPDDEKPDGETPDVSGALQLLAGYIQTPEFAAGLMQYIKETEGTK